MRKTTTTTLGLAIGLAICLPGIAAAAPANAAFDNANGHSAVLRCGTREPSEADKLLREESFLKLRSQLNRWMLFVVTELEQPLWRIARNSFLYPEQQRQPKDIEIAQAEFRSMAAVLEKHMRGREYLVGDRVSVGDFIAAHTLDWGNEVGLLDQCPTLLAYMQRMYDRPKAAMRIKDALASVGEA